MNDKTICLLKAAYGHALDLREFHRGRTDPEDFQKVTDHIELLKAAIRELENKQMDLASSFKSADGDDVSQERINRENDQLICAMHGLEKELIRMTGELRSALLVSSKSDLRITGAEMKISELTGTVNEVKATTLKVLAEIRARVDLADARIVTLEGQLADADVPEAAAAALAELKTIVGQLDDITPDSTDLPPVTPPVVTPPTTP